MIRHNHITTNLPIVGLGPGLDQQMVNIFTGQYGLPVFCADRKEYYYLPITELHNRRMCRVLAFWFWFVPVNFQPPFTTVLASPAATERRPPKNNDILLFWRALQSLWRASRHQRRPLLPAATERRPPKTTISSSSGGRCSVSAVFHGQRVSQTASGTGRRCRTASGCPERRRGSSRSVPHPSRTRTRCIAADRIRQNRIPSD